MTDYEDAVEYRNRCEELEAALTDALYAYGLACNFVCGCGFVEPKDTRDYEEAEERIQKARAVLRGKEQVAVSNLDPCSPEDIAARHAEAKEREL